MEENNIQTETNNYESVFQNILDKDETIIKVFKPNKAKMFWSMFMFSFFIIFWVVLCAAISIFDPQDTTLTNGEKLATFFIILAAGLFIIWLITYIFYKLSYKNTYYAYSNKRVIIRRGIFGVDFKSLDMSMIGAVTVNVSLLDKIIHKNTGTIVFGSMASPMGSNGMLFNFANIVNPYEVYKEIKSVIDEKKTEKK